MDDVVREALRVYATINPNDRRDTEFHASRKTIEYLVIRTAPDPDRPFFSDRLPLPMSTLFGITLREDDDLPFGVIHAITETETDRAIRRARRDGIRVNVLRPIRSELTFTPAPPPTLRALLRKWRGKIRK